MNGNRVHKLKPIFQAKFEILASIFGMGNSDNLLSKCVFFINFLSEKYSPFMLLKQFIT